MDKETEKDIIDRLTKAYDFDPQRYMKFENAVYRLLLGMPDNSLIKLSELCKSSSLPLMKDVVKLFISDTSGQDGCFWEFIDDDTVHRSAEFHQSVPRPLPKWDPNTTE